MKNRFFEKMTYIVKILIAYPIALLKKNELIKKNIWLIGISYDRYENNCKEFYEYLLEKENVFWVLDKKNYDNMKSMVSKDKMIFRGTVRDYVMAHFARVGVYSASDFDIAPGLYRVFGKKTCLVNISHGYDTIKIMDPIYYKRMPADIIICASEHERETKVCNFSADPERAFVTGFARCDKFICKEDGEIRKIMIMPTWRNWYIEEGIQLKESGLYSAYKELLEKLDKFLDGQSDIEVYFLFHPIMADFFVQKPIYEGNHIRYVFEQSKVSTFLKESDLLITDYSSISFDYIYMKKPIIYFWFDYNEYKNKYGLYKDQDSFERICFKADDVIQNLKDVLESEVKYSEIDRNKYWDYFDGKNCERIYNCIVENEKYRRFGEDVQ